MLFSRACTTSEPPTSCSSSHAGARHHRLDPEYITFLDSLQPYDGSGVAPAIGRAAAVAMAAPFALPLLPPVLLLRYLRKQQQDQQQAPAGSGGGGGSGGSDAAATTIGASALSAAKGATDLASKATAMSSGAPPASPAASAAADKAAAGPNSDSKFRGSSANGKDNGRSQAVPQELLQPPATMPAVMGKYINAVQSLTWLAHDILAAPVLGSGSSSSVKQ